MASVMDNLADGVEKRMPAQLSAYSASAVFRATNVRENVICRSLGASILISSGGAAGNEPMLRSGHEKPCARKKPRHARRVGAGAGL